MVARYQGSRNRKDLPQVSLWTNVVMLTIAVGFAAGYRLGHHRDAAADDTASTLSTRVYQVQDILAQSDNGQQDLSAIVSHIHQAIEPASWQAPDRMLLAYSRQKSIVVKQTPEVHLQITTFLDDLRAHRFRSQPAEIQHIREVLNPIRYQFTKVTFC